MACVSTLSRRDEVTRGSWKRRGLTRTSCASSFFSLADIFPGPRVDPDSSSAIASSAETVFFCAPA